jgi:hypothetical protein
VCATNAFISGSPKSLPHAPAKPPPKPLRPRDAEAAAVDLDDGRVAFEHGDPARTQHVEHLGNTPRVVVVVAQHDDDRHADIRDLGAEDAHLLGRAATREITGDEQHVGL